MTPLAVMLQPAADPVEPLSSLGATIMGLSIGTVVLVLSYCLYKVLTLPPAEPATSDAPAAAGPPPATSR